MTPEGGLNSTTLENKIKVFLYFDANIRVDPNFIFNSGKRFLMFFHILFIEHFIIFSIMGFFLVYAPDYRVGLNGTYLWRAKMSCPMRIGGSLASTSPLWRQGDGHHSVRKHNCRIRNR
jgi:hypothetical protein